MNPCPNCGIAGNNFNCPNHVTYWGINPLPDSIPMPTQSAWASLYAEIGRLNVLLNERNKEIAALKQTSADLCPECGWRFLVPGIGCQGCERARLEQEIERLKSLMPPDERGPGFVGQGSWSVYAEKVVEERDALREILAGLREKGIIDHLNRILPLEDHHKDCGHGKDGWSLCTCVPLKQAERERANKQFKDLVEEGQELRKEFDKQTAGMRGPPQCSKCGDTGLVAYGPNLRGMKHCDCGRLSNGQPTIKTPEGKPLLPPAEFSAMRIEDNKERGFSECHFQRQTGRTTAMVLKALEFVKENAMGEVLIEVHSNQMKKNVNKRLKHYADETGVEQAQLSRVCVEAPREYSLRLRDNVFEDMKVNKPARDPHQDLTVGDIVRFERTGVITARQSGGIVKDYEGNDFEPVQYVIRENLSGNKSFVPCNQILTVIGKEEE